MTNFKCGPDSYVKHFIGAASPDPFLVLQFDEHTNDAGAMTRCEAYLDSKGFLRWWARGRQGRRATGRGRARWTPRPRPRAATARPTDETALAALAAVPKPAAAHGADTSPVETDIDIKGRTLWLTPHALRRAPACWPPPSAPSGSTPG